MKPMPIFLILAVIVLIATMIAFQFPDQAERLSEMRRSVAFEGETRDIMMAVAACGIGALVVYLIATRR